MRVESDLGVLESNPQDLGLSSLDRGIRGRLGYLRSRRRPEFPSQYETSKPLHSRYKRGYDWCLFRRTKKWGFSP